MSVTFYVMDLTTTTPLSTRLLRITALPLPQSKASARVSRLVFRSIAPSKKFDLMMSRHETTGLAPGDTAIF